MTDKEQMLENKRRERKRKKLMGWVRFELWARKPEHKALIRKYADSLK